MNNLTLSQKEELASFEAQGRRVFTVAYDPTTVVGTPDDDALAQGLTEYYREETAHLIEVIYVSGGNPT
jgi:hypothetical protein